MQLSRFYLNGLVKAAIRERPANLRRRILLERAAWQFRHTSLPVIEIALGAGYEDPSSFARAFRSAFGHAPSRHRSEGGTFRLPATNGLHVHPPAASPRASSTRP